MNSSREILDVGGAGAGGEGLFVRGLEIFALAEIADHGDYFAAAVSFLEPRNDDGGIQTSRVGKYDFFGQRILLN